MKHCKPKNLLTLHAIVWMLLLISCTSHQRLYYGVHTIDNVTVTRVEDGYAVKFYTHIGKDADYYTIDYYLKDELLYSSVKNVDRNRANYTIGYLEQFHINQKATVTIVITSYIGETFLITDRKEFTVNIK